MPDQKEYYDLLYAYTFGCLDNEELEKLQEYLATGENFPWQELGEFQNLSSLLPSILSIESPPQVVKDKVARKLYRIRQEIKAKRDARKNLQKKTDEEKSVEGKKDEVTEEQQLDDEEIQQDLKDKFEPDVEEFEVVSHAADEKDTASEEIENSLEATPEIKSDEEIVLDFSDNPEEAGEDEIDTISMTEEETVTINKTKEEIEAERQVEEKRLKKRRRYTDSIESEKNKKKSSLPLVLLFIVLLIITAVVVFLYFQASSNVKKYQSQVNSLNQQITYLTNQFDQNKEIQTILNTRNLVTVDLENKNRNSEAFGKLFISTDLNKGFLQLTNLKSLSDNGTYQLWINYSRKNESLLKFNPADNNSYLLFSTPQINANTRADFIITSEPEGGSEQPGKNIFLEGRIR